MPQHACPTCGRANPTRYCPEHKPRQAPGRKLPAALRRAVLDRDGHRCQLRYPLACTGAATHVDHKRPHSKGGDDSMDNLQAACATCNKSKGAR